MHRTVFSIQANMISFPVKQLFLVYFQQSFIFHSEDVRSAHSTKRFIRVGVPDCLMGLPCCTLFFNIGNIPLHA